LSAGANKPLAAPSSANPPSYSTDYEIDRDGIIVPFTYRSNQIIVRGEAAGHPGLSFLFDTGSSACVVEESLGLDGVRTGKSLIREADGETSATTVWLSGIALRGEDGTVAARNISALEYDLSRMSRMIGQHIDGILGVSFFSGYVVEIDYEHGLLRFHTPQCADFADQHADNVKTFSLDLMPGSLTQLSPCLMLEGKLNGTRECPFLLDTGFGGYLSVPHAAAIESGLMNPDTPQAKSSSYGLTRRFETSKIRASLLSVGGIDLSGHVITVDFRNHDRPDQAGIVGNKLLQDYRVRLDYHRRRLWLTQISATAETDDLGRPQIGLDVQPQGHSVRVVHVDRNSPAHESGVHVGDTILAINGMPLDLISTDTALKMLRSPSGVLTLAMVRAVDPNLGTSPGEVTVRIMPKAPLEWKSR
jgi:hypothetical protein